MKINLVNGQIPFHGFGGLVILLVRVAHRCRSVGGPYSSVYSY